MVPRRSAHRSATRPTGRLALTAVPLAIALVVSLSGCSPLSLFASWGASTPRPSASRTAEAGPTPTGSPSPTKTASPTPGCVDRIISAAGVYRIDSCENLIVSGSGVKVTAAHLGTLTIVGDSLQVYADTIGALNVQGSRNTVQTNDQIGTILVTGDGNMITCHAGITSVIVNGDDNAIAADGGVDGTVENNGQRNTIGAQP